jgi:hypothetical protein
MLGLQPSIAAANAGALPRTHARLITVLHQSKARAIRAVISHRVIDPQLTALTCLASNFSPSILSGDAPPIAGLCVQGPTSRALSPSVWARAVAQSALLPCRREFRGGGFSAGGDSNDRVNGAASGGNVQAYYKFRGVDIACKARHWQALLIPWPVTGATRLQVQPARTVRTPAGHASEGAARDNRLRLRWPAAAPSPPAPPPADLKQRKLCETERAVNFRVASRAAALWLEGAGGEARSGHTNGLCQAPHRDWPAAAGSPGLSTRGYATPSRIVRKNTPSASFKNRPARQQVASSSAALAFPCSWRSCPSAKPPHPPLPRLRQPRPPAARHTPTRPPAAAVAPLRYVLPP